MDNLSLPQGKYRIDRFNLNPIFCVSLNNRMSNKERIFVRSWNDALELKNNQKIKDISPEYIAKYMAGSLSSKISPFNGIKRLPKFSNVEIDKDGSYKCKSLLKNRFEKKNSSYAQTKEILISQMKNIIRNEPNLVVEHSSGLDSNIILSTLIKELNYSNSKVKTISYEAAESKYLLNKLRKFFDLIETNIHKFHSHFDKSQSEMLIKIFGFPPQIHHNLQVIQFLKNTEFNIILSGLGGDQCLTHNGVNALNNLLEEFEIKKIWEFNPKINFFIKFLIKNFIHSKMPIVENLFFNPKNKNFWRKDLLTDFLTPFGKRKLSKYLPKNEYQDLSHQYDLIENAISKELNSDGLAIRVEEETRLAEFFKIKKEFPLLGSELLDCVQNIAPKMFIKDKGNTRVLGKELSKDLLPEYFFNFPSKKRINDENKYFLDLGNHLISENIELLNNLNNNHKYTFKLIDILRFKEFCINAINHKNDECRTLYEVNQALRRIFLLNKWFCMID